PSPYTTLFRSHWSNHNQAEGGEAAAHDEENIDSARHDVDGCPDVCIPILQTDTRGDRGIGHSRRRPLRIAGADYQIRREGQRALCKTIQTFPAYTCHIACPENNTQIDPIHEHLTRRDRRYVLPAGICNDCHLAAQYVYPPEGIQKAADQFILICCLFFLSAQI